VARSGQRGAHAGTAGTDHDGVHGGRERVIVRGTHGEKL
jgi:hypothetical protein